MSLFKLRFAIVAALVVAAACDKDEDCFSPTRNLDKAGDPGARGCECDPADTSQYNADGGFCIFGGFGIECARGRWRAFSDGPCRGDDNVRCFSPFENLDAAYSGAGGCACEDTATNRAGYCVERAALYCQDGKWVSAEDGVCAPGMPITGEACTAAGGKPVMDPENKLEFDCAAPLARLNELTDGQKVIGSCCVAIVLSATECASIGGQALSDPGDGSLLVAGCPDGQKQLGTLSGFEEGGLCCAQE